jgi:hypothetical protein
MRILKAISGVLLVLMVTSIIPSLAFAADNSTAPNQWGFHHGGFLVGDFATVKAKVLDFLNNEISRLQGISANVSAANNMTELQAALGRDKVSPRLHEMNIDGNGFALAVGGGFRLNEIVNVNDTTYPTVKTNMVNSLQNMTATLQNQENKATANNNTLKATQIANKIAVLQNLTNQINTTTDAAGLQDVALTFMKGQFDDAINKQVAQFQNKENNTTDANVTANINTRIANLKTLETNINNATSLSALQTVLSSSNIMVSLNNRQMEKGGFRGHGRFNGVKNIC